MEINEFIVGFVEISKTLILLILNHKRQRTAASCCYLLRKHKEPRLRSANKFIRLLEILIPIVRNSRIPPYSYNEPPHFSGVHRSHRRRDKLPPPPRLRRARRNRSCLFPPKRPLDREPDRQYGEPGQDHRDLRGGGKHRVCARAAPCRRSGCAVRSAGAHGPHRPRAGHGGRAPQSTASGREPGPGPGNRDGSAPGLVLPISFTLCGIHAQGMGGLHRNCVLPATPRIPRLRPLLSQPPDDPDALCRGCRADQRRDPG